MLDFAFWSVVAFYLFFAVRWYRHQLWVRKMRAQIAHDMETLP